jgi:hypothetical protein
MTRDTPECIAVPEPVSQEPLPIRREQAETSTRIGNFYKIRRC